jgi:hypothetical protein
MLTKLNDLRASESVIFIMATNYAERIDAAIKRQGRIDEHCLLLPPDRWRRRIFIKELWSTGTIDVEKAAEKSVFLGYGDLNSVNKGLNRDQAIRELGDMPRPATPEMYVSRFNDKSGQRLADLSRTPVDEFFAMVSLQADAQGLKNGSKAWQAHVRSKCKAIFDGKDYSKIGHALTKFINNNAP